MKWCLQRLCLAVLLVVGSSATTNSADLIIRDVTPSTGKMVRYIAIEGEIATGDSQKLQAAMEGHLVPVVALNSPGGDVVEAMSISRMMNDRIVTAYAPDDFRNDPSGRISCGRILF